jgi:hypothetical protein
MKLKLINVLFSVTIVTMLVLGSFSLVLADTSQKWYCAGSFILGAPCDFYMYRNDDGKAADEPIVLGNGDGCCWCANETASADVTFLDGDWQVQVTTSVAPTYGDNFTVYIGYHDGDNFNAEGSHQFTGDDETTVFSKSLNIGSFTVYNGDYLAVRLLNDLDSGMETSVDLVVGSDYTYIQSPDSDPGYPVPDMPGIVLISLGLLVCGGYVWFKRRHSSPAKQG